MSSEFMEHLSDTELYDESQGFESVQEKPELDSSQNILFSAIASGKETSV